MGWSIRKTLRILPGVRVNLSKNGPRLSIGIPGARASIGIDGKANIYGGKGPFRYRRTVALYPTICLRDRLSNLSKTIKSMFCDR
jgi:hypothetical protein